MRLRAMAMAVAVAALSLAGAAMAAGNDTKSATGGSTDRMPTARQGQTLDQSTAGNAGGATQGASQGMSTPKMNGSNAAPSANASSQGSNMANEEHDQQLVRSAQQALKQKGFDVGAVDGQMGPETENALRQFQQSKGLPQSGNLDTQTLSALGVNGSQAGSTSSMGSSQGSQGSQQSSRGSQSQSSSIHSSAYK